MNEFSKLAQDKTARNLANVDELDAWLNDTADDKLGHDARAQKARQWVASVGRKRMMREGEVVEISPMAARALASSMPWVAKSIDEGRAIHRLSLGSGEAEELSSILDWMRSERGPGLASDWSRVSWPQAAQAHHAWIDEMAKEARKLVLAQQAFEGCETVAPVQGVEGLEGWSWVRVESAQALEREGALMRHCVGSYAEQVEDGSLSIWSLRDPEGKPLVTVETREAQGGLEARQIKGFANSIPKAPHAQALGSLFEHFEAAGAPLFQAGPDLAKAGLGVTPLGLGSPKLWRKGDAQDEALLAARVEALSSQDALAMAISAGQLAGDLGFKSALKALAAKLPKDGLSPQILDRLSVSAFQAGLAWGEGVFAGHALDPKDPADVALCERLAREHGPGLKGLDAIATARFLAQGGFPMALSLLEPALVEAAASHPAPMDELNRQLLAAKPAAAMLGGRLWTAEPSQAKAWSDCVGEIARNPASSPQEGLAALELCLAREDFEHAGLLVKFLGDASEDWAPRQRAIATRARHIGVVIERADAEKGIEATLWRKDPALEARALERALADPSTSNPILLVAAHMGWTAPVQAIVKDLDDRQALDLARELISLGGDAAWIGARAGLSREELYGLRQEAARAGMIKGVQDTLAVLERLPGEAFADMDQELAKAHQESFSRWKRIFDDMETAVVELEGNPKLCQGLSGQRDAAQPGQLLESSPSWRLLREHVGESASLSVGLFVECFAQALANRCESMSVAVGEDRELTPGAKTAFAHFMNERVSGEQRDALIKAITGFSKMQGRPKNGSLSLAEKLAARRQAWGGEVPSWAQEGRARRSGPL